MADHTLSASLWYNAQLLASLVDSFYKMVSDPLGLTVVEWHVLHALYRQDGQRASELARAVGRQQTSFTPILDSLERKGWIARQADSLDRRAVRMYLTQNAQQNRSQFEHSIATLEDLLRGQLGEADLFALIKLREQLVLPVSLSQTPM
jgi:DNA-binding MarR family transcriptional regulator